MVSSRRLVLVAAFLSGFLCLHLSWGGQGDGSAPVVLSAARNGAAPDVAAGGRPDPGGAVALGSEPSRLGASPPVGASGRGGAAPSSSSGAAAGTRPAPVAAAGWVRGKERYNLSVEKLAWLHIPKTGTSFVNILITWGCPRLGEDEFFDGPPDLKWEGWFRNNWHKCHPGLRLGCGHDEIRASSNNRCMVWERQQGHFVTFLRQPEQRLMSGFYNSKWGVKNKSLSLAEYVPLLQGCQTRMLSGHRCESSHLVTDADVQLAIKRIDTGFAFVGITEEWPLSVCLFHAMFGGSCHVRELWAWHSQLRLYDESELEGFKDVHDRKVYEHGVQTFRKTLREYNVDQESCDAHICRVPKCHLTSPPKQNVMVKCDPQ